MWRQRHDAASKAGDGPVHSTLTPSFDNRFTLDAEDAFVRPGPTFTSEMWE
jgi:hypothetical protein